MGLIHRRPATREARQEAYERYMAFCAGRPPARTPLEIQSVILAAALRYEDAGAGFWHSLRADWLAGEQDLEPFEDAPGANQEFRVLALLRGLLPACCFCESPLPNRAALFCGELCANAWREHNRPLFTVEPGALPSAAFDTLAALIAGRAVAPEAEAALAACIDGANTYPRPLS